MLLGEIRQGNLPELLHFSDAGGAGDIDLAEMTSDHIDAYKEQPGLD